MNERDFLDAISKATDDFPRLAFADWLEERGDLRAAGVRNLQIWDQFMAPDAADPIQRMARAAFWRNEWERISKLAEELGEPAFFSFMGAYAEYSHQEWNRQALPRVRRQPRSETADRVAKALQPWLVKYARPAWKPVVEDEDGPPTASKFSGTPWIGEGAPWPNCNRCHQPMLLFVQLNLSELPEELGDRFGPGLLQLFHCPQRECGRGVPGDHFSTYLVCVRVVHPQGPSQLVQAPACLAHFPALGIGGWARFIDLPDANEHEGLGLHYNYDFDVGKTRVECPEFGVVFDNIDINEHVAEAIASSKSGDKLSGWPYWVQNVNYPNCPRCGRQMVYIFQVASEDNVPYMFGDSGTGHITQCPEHKDVVAFGWDCC
jgi:uncharacterized protein (TIGR02996 family)